VSQQVIVIIIIIIIIIIINYYFIIILWPIVPVKEYCKSANVWWNYDIMKLGGLLFWVTVSFIDDLIYYYN